MILIETHETNVSSSVEKLGRFQRKDGGPGVRPLVRDLLIVIGVSETQ